MYKATQPNAWNEAQSEVQSKRLNGCILHLPEAIWDAGVRSQALGQWGEDQALEFLQQQGLRVVERNWRAAGVHGTELDLILLDGDTLVFVEVKLRVHTGYGGASQAVSVVKQQRIIKAAQHYLSRYGNAWPACRFDVVTLEMAENVEESAEKADKKTGEKHLMRLKWLESAFVLT